GGVPAGGAPGLLRLLVGERLQGLRQRARVEAEVVAVELREVVERQLEGAEPRVVVGEAHVDSEARDREVGGGERDQGRVVALDRLVPAALALELETRAERLPGLPASLDQRAAPAPLLRLPA